MKAINLKKFIKKSLIGSGTFGSVYIIQDKKTGEQYAAKISSKPTEIQSNDEKKNFSREINNISKVNFPTIVKFIGYSPINFENENKQVIVTEYLPNGSLEGIIDMERKSLSDSRWDDTKKLINIYGIAAAMKFLHDLNIIHRDLKPENILLDEDLNPKIADFGLSKDLNLKNTTATIDIKGTPIYIAPEIYTDEQYSTASDVYAFAFIVYEIITNEKPFIDKTMFRISNKIVNGYRPEIKYFPSDAYRELIASCWSQAPADRPSFKEILEELATNPGFITDMIRVDEFEKYIHSIEEFKEKPERIQETESEDSQESEPKNERKTKLYPNKDFLKLTKECQNAVIEAENDPKKQFLIGKNLIEGLNGFPKKIKIGITYLKSSIKESNLDAVIYYNTLLIKGKYVPQSLKEAKVNLEKIDKKLQNSEIKTLIGIIYKKQEKYEKAIDILYDASEEDNAEAFYQLGKMVFLGIGTDVNKKNAMAFFDSAKKNGCTKVERFLEKYNKTPIDVVFMIDGTGTMKAFHDAFRSLFSSTMKKCKEKYQNAHFRFAVILYKNEAVTNKMSKSIKMNKKNKLVYIQLTDNLADIQEFINSIDDDLPILLKRANDWASGYNCLINDINWNNRAKKLVIHICDAPGHGKSFQLSNRLFKKFMNYPKFSKNYSLQKNIAIYKGIQNDEDDKFKELISESARKKIMFFCLNGNENSLICFNKVGDFYKEKNGPKFVVDDLFGYSYNKDADINVKELKDYMKDFILSSIKVCANEKNKTENNLFEKNCKQHFEKDLLEIIPNKDTNPKSSQPKTKQKRQTKKKEVEEEEDYSSVEYSSENDDNDDDDFVGKRDYFESNSDEDSEGFKVRLAVSGSGINKKSKNIKGKNKKTVTSSPNLPRYQKFSEDDDFDD